MTGVQDRLEMLAECLCAQIKSDALPDVCFCGLVNGEQAAFDYAGQDCGDQCGMAWVRLITIYPSVSLGEPSIEADNCGKLLGFDVEVGIVRCVSVPDEEGNPPTPGMLLADTELQVADALTMRRAILCCVSSSKDVRLGIYTPIGPSGGLGGGMWTASLMEN